MEGPLTNLKTSMIQFSKPIKFNPVRRLDPSAFKDGVYVPPDPSPSMPSTTPKKKDSRKVRTPTSPTGSSQTLSMTAYAPHPYSIGTQSSQTSESIFLPPSISDAMKSIPTNSQQSQGSSYRSQQWATQSQSQHQPRSSGPRRGHPTPAPAPAPSPTTSSIASQVLYF